MSERVISVDGGHGSVDLERICEVCKTHPTMMHDGGWEKCTNEKCDFISGLPCGKPKEVDPRCIC